MEYVFGIKQGLMSTCYVIIAFLDCICSKSDGEALVKCTATYNFLKTMNTNKSKPSTMKVRSRLLYCCLF